MGRKLQIILGLSIGLIFASSIASADSNFSMFNLGQAFAEQPLEEGQIIIISADGGDLCTFEFIIWGAIFEVDPSSGTPTKIWDACPGPRTGFPGEVVTNEIDIAIDPIGRTFVLDQLYPFESTPRGGVIHALINSEEVSTMTSFFGPGFGGAHLHHILGQWILLIQVKSM